MEDHLCDAPGEPVGSHARSGLLAGADGGTGRGSKRRRGDRRTIWVAGQDREGQRHLCPWVLAALEPVALALCNLKPQRDPKAHPKKGNRQRDLVRRNF